MPTAGACAEGDHQVLQGEGQGHGIQGILADLCHEHAVHHIVAGLDQHGDHHGDRHVGQQPSDGQHAHLVLLGRRALVEFFCHGNSNILFSQET